MENIINKTNQKKMKDDFLNKKKDGGYLIMFLLFIILIIITIIKFFNILYDFLIKFILPNLPYIVILILIILIYLYKRSIIFNLIDFLKVWFDIFTLKNIIR